VSEFNLTARTPLNAARLEYPGITIEEVTNCAIVSIATPLQGETAINDALQSAYSVSLPTVGQSAKATIDNAIVLALSQDQHFIVFDEPDGTPTAAVGARLGETAYIVDQSDGWVIVRMTGGNCRAALERICPLDLNLAEFAPGAVARTVMEHLATIILCESRNSYLLLSPRSSAKSFLHAVDVSARNVS
jgi:methylglutamate dehydrogenase subunit D